MATKKVYEDNKKFEEKPHTFNIRSCDAHSTSQPNFIFLQVLILFGFYGKDFLGLSLTHPAELNHTIVATSWTETLKHKSGEAQAKEAALPLLSGN